MDRYGAYFVVLFYGQGTPGSRGFIGAKGKKVFCIPLKCITYIPRAIVPENIPFYKNCLRDKCDLWCVRYLRWSKVFV